MSGISKPKMIDWQEDQNGCWNCTSHKAWANEYPKRKYRTENRKGTLARFIYEECFGDIPKGMLILHKCDNKMCINPEHIYLGTYKQNLYDRIREGKFPSGENNGHAKLTWDIVNKIRDEYQKGNSQQLAHQYNIHQTAISRIVNNQRWKEQYHRA